MTVQDVIDRSYDIEEYLHDFYIPLLCKGVNNNDIPEYDSLPNNRQYCALIYPNGTYSLLGNGAKSDNDTTRIEFNEWRGFRYGYNIVNINHNLGKYIIDNKCRN